MSQVLSYEPLEADLGVIEARRAIHVVGLPLVNRLVATHGDTLRQIGRRARRIGPVDTGCVVLVSGCDANVGCSTMSLALAMAAAAERSLLLIDGDFKQPHLARMLGITPKHSWADALRGLTKFDQTLCPVDRDKHLGLQPLVGPLDPTRDLIGTALLSDWLATLRKKHDIIVVDGGDVYNATRWAHLADVALLICGSQQTQADDWASAWDLLEETGTHVLGIIENMA